MTKPTIKTTFGGKGSVVSAPTHKASEPAKEEDREAIGAPTASEPGKGASEPSPTKKKKVSFYQLPAEEARARAAWMHTAGHTGHRTITSFMEAAVSAYTRELEKQYNDSTPFN